MDRNLILAYLAGLLDGDGYFKVTAERSERVINPYYGITVGASQLHPGEAIQLLSSTFGGPMIPLPPRPGLRPMVRWEIHDAMAEAALRELTPFLLVKRRQAELLLRMRELKSSAKEGYVNFSYARTTGKIVESGRPSFSQDQLASFEEIRINVLSLNEIGRYGTTPKNVSTEPAPTSSRWKREEVMAYLAGIMDSDGTFKIEKKRVKRMVNPHYRIKLGAAQVVPSPAIELLHATFAGSLNFLEPNRRSRRRMIWWSVHDSQADAATRELLPYLVVKKEQGEILLALRRLKSLPKAELSIAIHRTRWGKLQEMPKRRYSPEQVAAMEALRLRLIGLHRGPEAREPVVQPSQSLAPAMPVPTSPSPYEPQQEGQDDIRPCDPQ